MTVFLTLGDGDFSYSLDLVQYLSTIRNQGRNTLIVTGVDSLLDMKNKYKDCNYLLRQLQSFNSDDDKKLEVDIRHEVNAVDSSRSTPSISANVVIFNHPHLGTEDAARHSRFLSHFLHECNEMWLLSSTTNSGTVHLTLAAGQWERWQGEKAASKHGFILKHRVPFQSPSVEESKYQHRRHQTGKSFQNRTAGSETFVLVRSMADNAFLFAWQTEKESLKLMHQPSFECSSCDRTFKEERSLKSHMKALHGDSSSNKKRKIEMKCPHCELQGIAKTFSQEQALMDHVQAKHSGPHTTIQPDWASDKKNEKSTSDPTQGICQICEYVFRDVGDASRHSEEFLPTEVSLPCDSFYCQFCAKSFSDQRGQLQHENFCKQRLPPVHDIPSKQEA